MCARMLLNAAMGLRVRDRLDNVLMLARRYRSIRFLHRIALVARRAPQHVQPFEQRDEDRILRRFRDRTMKVPVPEIVSLGIGGGFASAPRSGAFS